MYNLEHSIEEDRYIALGKVNDILFVVFIERKESPLDLGKACDYRREEALL